MMDCQEALTLLSGRLDGENTEAEERALDAHLETCPECRAVLEAYREIDAGVAGLTVEPPEILAQGVMNVVRKPVKKRRSMFGGGTLAAAAVVALMLVAAGPFAQRAKDAAAPASAPMVLSDNAAPMAMMAREAVPDAAFAPADELLLVEIVDRADAPAAETVAAFDGLLAILVDGNAQYVVDAAEARAIVAACADYDVSAPEALFDMPDDVPVAVRIVAAKTGE